MCSSDLHLRIQERIIRETPRAVWYVSIPMLDDEVRRRVEPHAPSIGSRLELIDQLIEAGHVVTVGVNPLTAEWMPQFEPLLDLLKAKGVWGVWIEVPYFSKSFKGNLSKKARDRLGEDFIRARGEKGSKSDIAHGDAALVYAQGIDPRAVEATPIGVTCRLCNRPACTARAVPPVGRDILPDDTRRTVAPFAFDEG